MGCCGKCVYLIPVFAVAMYFTRQFMQGGECTSTDRVDGKTIIVTGANTGIGKITVEDLVQRGGRVIMACRSMERCNNAAEDVKNQTGVKDNQLKTMKLDLASLKSIRLFVEEFKKSEKRLDILINNAGVMWLPYTKTEEGFESHFGINHLGHFYLTNLLLDTLKKSAPSRIVTVSSYAHEMTSELDFDDLMGEKSYSRGDAYAKSKLANVLFNRELSKHLEGTGVTTYALHPGAIFTELQREIMVFPLDHILRILMWPFFKDLRQGAQTQICCAVSKELAKETGKYYSDCVEKIPTEAGQDDKAAKKLWDVSMKLVGLS